MKDYQNIGIKLRPESDHDISQYIFQLVDWLQNRNKNIQFLDNEKDRMNSMFSSRSKKIPTSTIFQNEEKFYSNTDLIITMGGDGTIIGACRKSHKHPVPVFGVNLGDLGFITEFNKDEFIENLEKFFNHEYQIAKQQLFGVEIFNNGILKQKEVFFNDVAISRSNISRVITLNLKSDNEDIFNTSGDGLIISSPIGSTAYSLSAGGPIVHPNVKALTITPICPHSLTHRPLVISDQSILEISLLGSITNATLTVDGQTAIPIGLNDKIVVSKEPENQVLLVKNDKRTYFQTLKDKFVHGRRYCHGSIYY